MIYYFSSMVKIFIPFVYMYSSVCSKYLVYALHFLRANYSRTNDESGIKTKLYFVLCIPSICNFSVDQFLCCGPNGCFSSFQIETSQSIYTLSRLTEIDIYVSEETAKI